MGGGQTHRHMHQSWQSFKDFSLTFWLDRMWTDLMKSYFWHRWVVLSAPYPRTTAAPSLWQCPSDAGSRTSSDQSDRSAKMKESERFGAVWVAKNKISLLPIQNRYLAVVENFIHRLRDKQDFAAITSHDEEEAISGLPRRKLTTQNKINNNNKKKTLWIFCRNSPNTYFQYQMLQFVVG